MSQLISKKTIASLILVLAFAVVGGLTFTSKKAEAACAAQDTSRGSVTSSFTVASAGTYSVKSRIQGNGTNDSFILEIDGTTCGVKVGGANTGTTGWTWVDYKDGNTSSKVTVTLAAGTHSMTLIGSEDNVQVDRVLFLTDAACTPSGTGDNCANPVDTTPPSQFSLTSPNNNSTLTGATVIAASPVDDTGVTKVEFYMGTSLLGSKTSAPYSFTLDPSAYPAGTYNLSAKAYDAAGNVTTSSPLVSVTIPPPPDTTAPTLAISTPLNGSALAGTVTVSGTATDASGIAKVEVLVDSAVKATLTTSPYTYSLDTTTLTKGSHTISLKAYDKAATPNVATQTVTVTVDNTPPPVTCDFTGDGHIGISDLSTLLTNYGKTVPAKTLGDCDGNGQVTIGDLSSLLTKYGQ